MTKSIAFVFIAGQGHNFTYIVIFFAFLWLSLHESFKLWVSEFQNDKRNITAPPPPSNKSFNINMELWHWLRLDLNKNILAHFIECSICSLQIFWKRMYCFTQKGLMYYISYVRVNAHTLKIYINTYTNSRIEYIHKASCSIILYKK